MVRFVAKGGNQREVIGSTTYRLPARGDCRGHGLGDLGLVVSGVAQMGRRVRRVVGRNPGQSMPLVGTVAPTGNGGGR